MLQAVKACVGTRMNVFPQYTMQVVYDIWRTHRKQSPLQTFGVLTILLDYMKVIQPCANKSLDWVERPRRYFQGISSLTVFVSLMHREQQKMAIFPVCRCLCASGM